MPDPNHSSEDFDTDEDAWYGKQPFRTPEAKGSFGGDLEVLIILEESGTLKVRMNISPHGIVVKVSFRGMQNEKIVSSFIYVRTFCEELQPHI